MFAAGDAKDLKEVNEEINKILREKINAEVQIELINFGAYRQQTNLVLSSGEPLDLMAILFTPTLASYVSNGMFLPLDDLLASKGTGILDIVPESALLCGKINGETYGVPNFKEWAVNYGFSYRKDQRIYTKQSRKRLDAK
jgi:putative aldouronate transport system substrate-binding protein